MNKQNIMIILIVAISLIIYIFWLGGFNINNIINIYSNQNSNSTEATCPGVSEMEDAIRLYKESNIIISFEPNLNTVYISPLAESTLEPDALQVLGYITACYSGYYKGNNLHWVEIYSSETNKKIAKYSEAYGFKMY